MPDGWAPETCTLPTAERPLRVAEFDELFAAVLKSDRSQPTRLNLLLPRHTEAKARDLARREGECCSFFSFDFASVGDGVVLHIVVPPSQIEVLDALEGLIAR